MANKTCITLAESSPTKLRLRLVQALKRSDYAELRFDFMAPIKIPIALDLVKKDLKRCICTLRPRSEGGKFFGSEKDRISILKLIAEYNPYLLDVEFYTIRKNKDLYQYLKKTKTSLLVSWHDFKKTPDENLLKKRLRQMIKFSKNVKIVTSAKTIGGSMKVLSLYKNLPKNYRLIAFAMGDNGRMSRILCTQFGSPYTYVSLGKPVAPGQFSLDEVKSIFKLKK
ncbi:MAG: type I 3-dehydroquinate dehydratase [Nitrosopumilaceae archaeon]